MFGNGKFDRQEILIICVILLTAVFVRLWFGSLIRDDAFITLRYAQRIADGSGFTFNDDQRVLGTSTPLWTLILAAASRIGGNLTTQAVLFGMISNLTCIVLLIIFCRSIWGRFIGLLAGFIFSILPPVIEHAVSGMETSLYLALILGAFIFFHKQRYLAASVFCGLITLIRPDGILVPISLGLFAFFQKIQRKKFWIYIMVFALIVLPWVIFSWSYFGSVVPQPIVAKWHLSVSRAQSLQLFLAYFADLHASWSFAIPFLSLLGAFFGFRGRLAATPFLLWNILYIGAFLVTSKFVYPLWPFEWYYIPPLLLYSLCAALGFKCLKDWLFKIRKTSAQSAYIIVFCLIILFVADSALHVYQDKHKIETLVKGREFLYQRMAQLLKERYRVADDWVAAWEIGAFGFQYPGPVLDLHGLVTPETVGMNLAQILPKYRPEWLISWNTSIPEQVGTSKWFGNHYRLVAEEVNWETRRLQLYRRSEIQNTIAVKIPVGSPVEERRTPHKTRMSQTVRTQRLQQRFALWRE